MSLLEHPLSNNEVDLIESDRDAREQKPARFPERLLIADDVVIDITEDRVDLSERPQAHGERVNGDARKNGEARKHVAPPLDGVRLRRVRLRSVAKVALLFWTVAYASLVGTAVVLWNAATHLGLISDTENLVVDALGMDSFDISGSSLFTTLAIGAGSICALGLIITLLLAIVYNVGGLLFGGLTVETEPLERSSRAPANA